MGFWNYRLVREQIELPNKSVQELYEIREAYYDEKGKIYAITADGIPAHGETPEEALESLEMIRKAFEKPVVNATDIPEEGAVAPGDPPEEFKDKE